MPSRGSIALIKTILCMPFFHGYIETEVFETEVFVIEVVNIAIAWR